MYTEIMTTAIGVICTLLVIAALVWYAFIYRQSDSDDKKEK